MDKVDKIIPKINGTSTTPSSFSKMHCDYYNELQGTLKGVECSRCKNKGSILVEIDGYTVLRMCECQKQRRALQALTKSGLKELVKEYTFDTYLTKEQWQYHIKQKALEYVTNPHQSWFFIGGQVGSGKTHICTAVVNRLMEKGFEAHYMLWRDEIVKLKSSVMETEEYQKSMTFLKEVKVLYIDDLFKTERGKSPTQSDIQITFEIINTRYNNKNTITLFSCEKLIQDLLEIDEAIGSRIYQMAKHYTIEIREDKRKNIRLR